MRKSVAALSAATLLIGTGLSAQSASSASASARTPVKDGPHFEIDCSAVPSHAQPLIAAKSAIIWSPLHFHTTDSKSQLKFYQADIQFEGDPASLYIDKTALPGGFTPKEEGRFANLRARVADDDFPTVFMRDGQTFEVRSTSPLPRKTTGPHSFSINFEKAFSILIESVPPDGSARSLGWAGKCTFNKSQAHYS